MTDQIPAGGSGTATTGRPMASQSEPQVYQNPPLDLVLYEENRKVTCPLACDQKILFD